MFDGNFILLLLENANTARFTGFELITVNGGNSDKSEALCAMSILLGD